MPRRPKLALVSVWGFEITLRRSTRAMTPLDERSAHRRDVYLATHNTHKRQIDIHAPGGIRTRNPNNRAATDPHLRPRGYWDRPKFISGLWKWRKLHLEQRHTDSTPATHQHTAATPRCVTVTSALFALIESNNPPNRVAVQLCWFALKYVWKRRVALWPNTLYSSGGT